MGAEVDPYPSRHHPPHSALQCPGKNRPDFLKTSYLFTARLQSSLLSLPLCSIDFLLTKNCQFSTPTTAAVPGLDIYLLHLGCCLSNSAHPQRQYICLTVRVKEQETVLTVHLHIKVGKNAPSMNTRQTQQKRMF